MIVLISDYFFVWDFPDIAEPAQISAAVPRILR